MVTVSLDEKRNGHWSTEEDDLLKVLVNKHGPKNWVTICKSIPGRTDKSCSKRWRNQLSPDIVYTPFTEEEKETIIEAHAEHGNNWTTIAKLLPGRTGYAIKNQSRSILKRKLCSDKAHHEGNGNEFSGGGFNNQQPPLTEDDVISMPAVHVNHGQEITGSPDYDNVEYEPRVEKLFDLNLKPDCEE